MHILSCGRSIIIIIYYIYYIHYKKQQHTHTSTQVNTIRIDYKHKNTHKASSHLKAPKNHFRYSRGYYFAHRKLFF